MDTENTQTNDNTVPAEYAELLKQKTVAELEALIKDVKKQKKEEEKAKKETLSKERQEQLAKLKDLHVSFGYSDATSFLKDYRSVNVPSVSRSRMSPEKRASIEQEIAKGTKAAAIAVTFDVSESTVSNIRKALAVKNATAPVETATAS